MKIGLDITVIHLESCLRTPQGSSENDRIKDALCNPLSHAEVGWTPSMIPIGLLCKAPQSRVSMTKISGGATSNRSIFLLNLFQKKNSGTKAILKLSYKSIPLLRTSFWQLYRGFPEARTETSGSVLEFVINSNDNEWDKAMNNIGIDNHIFYDYGNTKLKKLLKENLN